MKRFTTILLAIAIGTMFVSLAVAKDTGSKDVLRLTDARLVDGEWLVDVQVVNDQPIAGLDIPIRFGQGNDPIELKRVEFGQRVADWDFTHAQIDNQSKTVILGLISELVGTRANPDLRTATRGTETLVATLVFRVDDGFEPKFETFTTKSPGHELTFIYNDETSGTLEVKSYYPDFEVDAELKGGAGTLPTEYALSENFPNPFNPTTSFSLSLPEAADYKLRVYNIAGQLVKSLDGHAEAGVHTVTWLGDNNQGSPVASGVYFLKAEAGTNYTKTQKLTLLK